MSAEKYVAYVSTYTTGLQEGYGIHVYDVDVENGRFQEKGKVRITNSSYVTISHNKKYLYAITDTGVQSFVIDGEGLLTMTSAVSINGMRGCYLSTDYKDKFLFVAGFHDGKITVLQLDDNGSIKGITDEVYHKGLGSASERRSRPEVSCVKVSRDNQYLFAVDQGLDHVNVYELDQNTGKLKQEDIIRSDVDSGPRRLKFSVHGSYLYIVHEFMSYIDVYSYGLDFDSGHPVFEKIQTVPVVKDYHANRASAGVLGLSAQGDYLLSASAGDNSVTVFKTDRYTGELTKVLCLPVSGDYHKDAALFPDNRHLVSLNH